MKEINGLYNTAKVFTDNMDELSVEQIKKLCNQDFIQGSKIRIMPDVHSGAGCTIGTTMTIKDKVVPNLVGVDIGCGMETIAIKEKSVDLEKFDNLIYEKIPAGINIRKDMHKYASEIELEELRCFYNISHVRAGRSIGTLGGGNHFIEVDRDDDGNLYIVIHSGSRHLGKEAAQYYQEEAYKQLNGCTKRDIDKVILDLKNSGRQAEIPAVIENLRNSVTSEIPQELAYVSDYLFDDYIHDMKIIQKFAVLNRKAIADELVQGLGLTVEDEFTTIHNYIDTESMILRKGAVSARLGERLLIPINMRDGSLICTGKGNPDWNYSAPHGAGRILSRGQAKKRFTVEEFQETMGGIYTTSVNDETLDECPMAYKAMDEIMNNIKPTADIVKVIRPIYNFKAGKGK